MAVVLRTISGLLLLMPYTVYTSDQPARRELARQRAVEQETRDAAREKESKRLTKEVVGHALQELLEKAEGNLEALVDNAANQQERTRQKTRIEDMRRSLKESQEMA